MSPEIKSYATPEIANNDLVDGEFLVRRTNGSVEGGWSVASRFLVEDPKLPGVSSEMCVIEKIGDDGGVLQKTVSTSVLESWQPAEKKLIEASDIPGPVIAGAAHSALRSSVKLKEAEAISPVDAKLALQEEEVDLKKQLDKIKDEFKDSGDDVMNLWRYAANRLNKADAQRRGDGQASIDHGNMSGQGYNSLSPKAQAQAENYYRVFMQLDAVRSRLK